MTMSISTMLCIFLIGLCAVSIQGLTLRLKGNNTNIIPTDGTGKVNINDLPVGGCRRYETLECLSDVKYRGRKEEAYWEYTDPITLEDIRVDDVHCKSAGDCKNPDIGWWSAKGIYKRNRRYYGVLRLGRRFDNATWGAFSCTFKGDSNSPVSVTIVGRPTPPDPTPTDPTDAFPTTSTTDDQETATPIPSPSPNPTSTTVAPLPPETPTPSPSPDPTSTTVAPLPSGTSTQAPLPSLTPTNSTISSGSGFNDS